LPPLVKLIAIFLLLSCIKKLTDTIDYPSTPLRVLGD